VGILHLSGLIAALSPETARSARSWQSAPSPTARRSPRPQLRASFWKGREEELSRVFRSIAGLADILVGNEEDFQLALGIQGRSGRQGSRRQDRRLQGHDRGAKKAYPNAKFFATTLREVVNANEHLWGAILSAGDEWFVEEPRKIPVLDRIGGGDGFTGGCSTAHTAALRRKSACSLPGPAACWR
jgi:2-dehydro-3-deoxygluconokinase